MELSEFHSLVKSQGWDRLLKIASAQIEPRKNKILYEPLRTRDATLEQEFMKGEIAGIALFMRLPQDRIADLKDLMKANEADENGPDSD